MALKDWIKANTFMIAIALVLLLALIVMSGCTAKAAPGGVRAAAFHPPSTDVRKIKRIRVIYTVYRVA